MKINEAPTKSTGTLYEDLTSNSSGLPSKAGFGSCLLYRLSVIHGLFIVKLFGSRPNTLYCYLVHIPLACILLWAKVYGMYKSWHNIQHTNRHLIQLYLNGIMGIPDLICIQIHLLQLKRYGLLFWEMLDDINLKKYPHLHTKYLAPIGLLYFWTSSVGVSITSNIVFISVIPVTISSSCTYLIIMQVCAFLELIKVISLISWSIN